MNEMLSHIEYLLHSHNCVIVPNLGGFVVNTTSTSREGLSSFHAPACELVFNRDLTYNDGLLIESFMRVKSISFETAQSQINAAVKTLKEELKENKFVDLGDLGSFRMIDGQRFSYLPKVFIRPEYYGLSMASIEPIIQMHSKLSAKERVAKPTTAIWKKTSIGVAVAAVIAMVLLLFPIQDSTHQPQTAQIVTESGLFGSKIKKTETVNQTKNLIASEKEFPTNIPETTQPAPSASFETSEIETVTEPSTSHQYYIVAGVYEVKEYADKMIAQLKSEGYSNSSTLERSGRLIVFSETLPTIEDAQTALNELIKKHKNHNDAWIMKR